MGKTPQRRESYRHEGNPESRMQHPHDYRWDDPSENTWGSHSTAPKIYANNFSQPLPPIQERRDFQINPVIRQIPTAYNNGYPLFHPNVNMDPNINPYSLRRGPPDHSIDSLVGRGPSAADGYISGHRSDYNITLPQDSVAGYMNYRRNDRHPQPLARNDLTETATYLKTASDTLMKQNVETAAYLKTASDTLMKQNVLAKTADSSPSSLEYAKQPIESKKDLLRDFSMSVPGLSTENLSFDQILSILTTNSQDVLFRYLPHVHFMISCQQKLRNTTVTEKTKKLLAEAEFYDKNLAPIPHLFRERFQLTMHANVFASSLAHLTKLVLDTGKVQDKGCEAMKATFLGGMRDGQSWGLREWMSKNGGALKICNEMEMIFDAIQNLPKDSDITIRLADAIRNITTNAYQSLIKEVPKSYQALSPAHPFLPFFHRLESILKALSQFNPEDDDVVCLGDKCGPGCDSNTASTLETETVKVVSSDSDILPGNQAVSEACDSSPSLTNNSETNKTASDTAPTVEAPMNRDVGRYSMLAPSNKVEIETAVRCHLSVSNANTATVTKSSMSDPKPSPVKEDNINTGSNTEDNIEKEDHNDAIIVLGDNSTSFVRATDKIVSRKRIREVSANEIGGTGVNLNFHPESLPRKSGSVSPRTIETLAVTIDNMKFQLIGAIEVLLDRCKSHLKGRHQQIYGEFWDQPENFCFVLELLRGIILHPHSWPLIQHQLILNDPRERILYDQNVPIPLSLYHIAMSLSERKRGSDGSTLAPQGKLLIQGLDHWSMYFGKDLIEAIDLVFLNSLVCSMAGSNVFPFDRLKNLRELFWDDLYIHVQGNAALLPMKRSDNNLGSWKM